jgi:hypothetical protein
MKTLLFHIFKVADSTCLTAKSPDTGHVPAAIYCWSRANAGVGLHICILGDRLP